MDNIKNRLISIRRKLSKYSIEYDDFSDEDLMHDNEDYEDLGDVMRDQRDRLEDIYYRLDTLIEDAYEDYKPMLQEIREAVNEALSNIDIVATKARCPWELDIPEYDTEVTEAIGCIDDALSKLEEP